MNEQHLQQKKPRKILGNGLSTEYSNTINNINGYFWSTTLEQDLPPNNANSQNSNVFLTESVSSIESNNLIQQQQMERLRMSNLMNQEMHALWPYGTATFLSPMIPTHNMPLSYALAGTLPYAAVPIYQSLPNANAQPSNISPASSSSSGSSIATSSTQQQLQHHLVRSNSATNYSCVNESNPSLRNSPILSSEDTSGIIVNGGGGDATNSLSLGGNNATVTLSQAKFNELTRLALRGSEIAEKLAYTHRNRPCFKKIDSLCARMKQDLIRPDGVLPNINSQGIAWAVKDFIFVFTRVINAWIIIKGYVYNTPEGLNKVKSALSPDFQTSFAAWQDTTMDFIENLIKSFVNLDYLVQAQKNVYQKSDNSTAPLAANRSNNANTATTSNNILQHRNPLLEESFDFLNNTVEKCNQNYVDKNYIYTIVEDSEGRQRQATVNGTYFKTGTYTPIKKDTVLPGETFADNSSNNLITATQNPTLEQYIDERINEFWTPAVDIDLSTNVDCALPAPDADFIKFKENISVNWMNYDLRVLEEHLSEFSTNYDAKSPPRPLSKDFVQKLNIMIERLNAMKTADFFFKIQFTENYFPEFVAKHKNDFIDIRSIIFKCQIGCYQHINEVVHDVRKIVYAGKEFLKRNMHHHHPHNIASTSGTNTNAAQLPTQRRRKKRPNYGTRTVEVRRGYSGFGFTISGQQPCRLSCIIPNSPADQAGLRAGDCLISVNGLNVSKLPHETVVQLIGNSFGSIRMQIAEHYYSDSTDEENAATCSPAIPSLGSYRPRYIYHKTKQQRLRNSPMKKNESQLPLPRTTHTFKRCPVTTVKKPTATQLNLKRPLSEELKYTPVTANLATTSTSTVANVRAMVRAPLTSAALEYKAIVGYLGTIEMPKQISHSSKLQTVRSCIRKLRQEKRTPCTVLMVILPDCLKLISNVGNIMATYASSRLNYVSSSSESENRFFGLVTSTVYTSPPEENDDDDEDPIAVTSQASTIDHITISNSCHVFVVDTKLCDHSQHIAKAQEFRIECTKDPISSLCLEFPNNSEYVVNLIRSMYTMRIIPPATQRSMSDDPNLHAGGRQNSTAHSPQPSNHSEISTTTSNSDSGIGYNNDCSNITDRIVVVDFPHATSTRRSHGLLNVAQRPHNICQQDIQEDIASTSLAANKRLTVRAMPDPKIPYNIKVPVRCLITSRSCDDVLNLLEQESENYDNDQEALTSLPQQCYVSMDDISLYPQQPPKVEEHDFLRPHNKTENCDNDQSTCADVNQNLAENVNERNDRKKSLKLQFDTFNSLQDLACQSAEIIQSSPDKLASTPDLSTADTENLNSPFERGWIQTSLRTPRADKHTIQFSLAPETAVMRLQSYEAPSVYRSCSLTNSDADINSLNYQTSLNDLSKSLPKGPTAWSTSIEVLLADPAGIKSFAEFLKLEYAAENIFFWTACERFRNIKDPAERQAEALIIYSKHLTNGSLEPVNVDSSARIIVEQNLSKAENDLFQPAQKQIFNLMKFDCYQRFLKSELYKQCLQAEKKGKPLPYTGENLDELLKTTNFSESASLKLKKSASNAEEGRRRRSLLPWHRKANHARSKSKDRIAIEKSSNDNDSNSSNKMQLNISDNMWKKSISIHGSKSSLASFDAIPANELKSNYCRVKFPDGATTVTQLKPDETVAQLVDRLFEKRNLKYQFYDVSIIGPPLKSVELQSSAQELSRKEIEIEQRVAFKLDLPTPKIISVKSKSRKQLNEVVRPILQRYNINPEVVEVVMKETQEKVDLTQLVTHVDNRRLQVVLKKTYPPLPQTMPTKKPFSRPKNSIANGLQTAQSTLDEITNKVFSDLMHVKTMDTVVKPLKFDQCSLKSEECTSESSFFKRIRNSKQGDEVTRMSQIKSKKLHLATGASTSDYKLSIKDKIKDDIKHQLPLKMAEKQDDLLEDLKRAQLARLEDQRGTEINFELPEFLKNTENLNSSSNNNENSGKNTVEKPPQPAPRLSIINPIKPKHSNSPIKIEEEHSSVQNFEDLNTSLRGPPPLPPKPKVLPIKPSNWGVNITPPTKTSPLPVPSLITSTLINASANVAAISPNIIVSPSARCAYLDQPSSSFV